MIPLLAITGPDAATAFIEVGVIALALAGLARVASHFGVSAVPFFLIAGLGVGKGGVVDISVSEDFVSLGAEIGVLLLLLALGLTYTSDELSSGLRSGVAPGLVDAVLNFTPGLLVGLLLGWELPAAVLLGGVTWISSSGVVSKVLTDLDRLGNRETPAVLNLLVVEDLAMAVYLPVVAAVIAGYGATRTVVTVAIAIGTVVAVLFAAMRWGDRMSARLDNGNNEVLLLAVVGLTLLVGGLAQKLQISAAIGAFLVGLALSGPVQERASSLIEPLRDLFAAIFFLFFAVQIDPGEIPGVLVPAVGLLLITTGGKMATGWMAAKRIGASRQGRIRAGTALIARGEFSIVIASLGVTLVDGNELGIVAAAYVLLTAIAGPLAAKNADRISALTAPKPKATPTPKSTPEATAPPAG